MTLLEALGISRPEVISVTGFGGKTTILGRLRDEAEAAGLTLTLVEGEVPSGSTLVLRVAGLDVLGKPGSELASAEEFVTPEVLAAVMMRATSAPEGARIVYVLNKTDDEFRLQQAKQTAASASGQWVITVDGHVVWPEDDQAASG
jgi:hypothetical protein